MTRLRVPTVGSLHRRGADQVDLPTARCYALILGMLRSYKGMGKFTVSTCGLPPPAHPLPRGHAHTRAHARTRQTTHAHTRTHTHVLIRTQTHAQANTHAPTHAYTRARTHTHTNAHTHARAHRCASSTILRTPSPSRLRSTRYGSRTSRCVRVRVCVSACACVVSACACVRAHVRACARVCVCLFDVLISTGDGFSPPTSAPGPAALRRSGPRSRSPATTSPRAPAAAASSSRRFRV